MPITKSAIKAMKQADKARVHNRDIKASYRSKIKNVQKEVSTKGKDVAKLTSEAFSVIDKAVKKNIIHKNTGARRKSRLVLSINKHQEKPLVLETTKESANKLKIAKPKTPAKKPTIKKVPIEKKTTKKAS